MLPSVSSMKCEVLVLHHSGRLLPKRHHDFLPFFKCTPLDRGAQVFLRGQQANPADERKADRQMLVHAMMVAMLKLLAANTGTPRTFMIR